MPEKGYLLGQVKARIGETGRQAEKRTAQRLGARQTRNSGAMSGDKADLELPEFLCENKSTRAASMVLERGWLEKVAREALEAKRQPALTLQFTDSIGRPMKFGSWVLVPEALFEEIQAIYRGRMFCR